MPSFQLSPVPPEATPFAQLGRGSVVKSEVPGRVLLGLQGASS